jgi:uncharacterized protein
VDGSSRVRWEYVSPARADKARGLFFRYRDKDFSFTDCTSFILTRDLKLREALTTDHHFGQAGFGIKPGSGGDGRFNGRGTRSRQTA